MLRLQTMNALRQAQSKVFPSKPIRQYGNSMRRMVHTIFRHHLFMCELYDRIFRHLLSLHRHKRDVHASQRRIRTKVLRAQCGKAFRDPFDGVLRCFQIVQLYINKNSYSKTNFRGVGGELMRHECAVVCGGLGTLCVECGKAFRDACDLNRHMRCHPVENSCLCSTCSQAFSSLRELYKHEILQHDKVPVDKVAKHECTSYITPLFIRNSGPSFVFYVPSHIPLLSRFSDISVRSIKPMFCLLPIQSTFPEMLLPTTNACHVISVSRHVVAYIDINSYITPMLSTTSAQYESVGWNVIVTHGDTPSFTVENIRSSARLGEGTRITLPYIRNIFEVTECLAWEYNTTLSHKPANTLRRTLSNPNERSYTMLKTDVAYGIQ
ncbi:Zinc finger X-chromosomal protein [Clonorchis sinensis]|uniref:Zinc finger X-chromosomal protein n=1 Tax=Clonorchis sinensis TaxID=79923 RepID=A0A3R7CYP5_CLOSI|nr:Zinc finger X-chromosomal protein [Clonorchis sinensis]